MKKLFFNHQDQQSITNNIFAQKDDSPQNNDFVQDESQSSVALSNELKEPPMYRVLIYNDDYTPMEFVILILMKYFFKTFIAAEKIMLKIHKEGSGICGVFPREIAETKVRQVMYETKKHGYHLQCAYEPAT